MGVQGKSPSPRRPPSTPPPPWTSGCYNPDWRRVTPRTLSWLLQGHVLPRGCSPHHRWHRALPHIHSSPASESPTTILGRPGDHSGSPSSSHLDLHQFKGLKSTPPPSLFPTPRVGPQGLWLTSPQPFHLPPGLALGLLCTAAKSLGVMALLKPSSVPRCLENQVGIPQGGSLGPAQPRLPPSCLTLHSQLPKRPKLLPPPFICEVSARALPPAGSPL